jgi:VanZ family protein
MGGKTMLATNRPRPLHILRWTLAPLVTILLVVLLLQPDQQPIINTGIPPGPPSLARDLFFITGHILWFALLVVLWRWMLTMRFHSSSALLLAILIALVVGTSTEFAQKFVPGRGATVVDLLANFVGIGFAVIGVRHYEALRGILANRSYNPLNN